MIQPQPNHTDKNGVLRDVLYIVSVLSVRYRVGLLMIAAISVGVGLLDSFGLALLMPMVSLVTGTDFSGETTSSFVNFGERTFESMGHELTLIWMVSLIIGSQLARAGGIFLHLWVSALLKARFEVELRRSVFRSVLLAKWEYQLRQRLGQIMNTLTAETRRAGGTYNSLARATASFASMAVYLVVALTVSWQLSLAAIVGTVLIAFGLNVIIGYTRRLGVSRSHSTAQLNSDLAESISGLKFIKSSALELHSFERFDRASEEVGRVDARIGLSHGFLHSMAEVFFVIALVLALLAGSRVFNLTTSEIVLFAFLFFRIFQHAKGLQISLQGLSQDISALAVTQNLANEARSEAEPADGAPFDEFNNDIKIDGVTFNYRNNPPILDNVNIEIKKGDVVSIVGPSGVGKSTIIDLVAGLLTPSDGSISIDGIDLKSLKKTSWRSKISYVTQSPFLFNDTIANNIAWGADDEDSERIAQAAHLAGAHEFIANLKEDYDTFIGERGVLLSGGQRQRICLARAFYRSPQLLILDEATSELDSSSERLIKQAIDRVAGDMTVLIVAHRSSIVMSSNVVYVLQDGKVVEYGSPEELLAAGGIFSNMQAPG